MLNPDTAARIRTIFMHDGSSVTIVDFIILLGWSVIEFEDSVKWGIVTIEDPAAVVPRISHAQLIEQARERWSEAEIIEALGADAARALVPARVDTAGASLVCDAVRVDQLPAPQIVAPTPTAATLPAGLRPPHREPLPRRPSRSRALAAVVPPPSLPSSPHRRTDGVREATLASFEVRYQDLVPVLRLRGRWLARAGFKVGARIYIVPGRGQLIITTTDPMRATSRNAV